jgi:hypothetical protein
MHAVVFNVTIPDQPAAEAELRELVPRVSSAPGFVAAYWVALAGGKGVSIAVFDSEASAQAVAGMADAPGAPSAVTVDSIEVGTVVAHA